ncbi:MAG: ribosome-associated translation inhibitor RaiA [Bacillota bacterium]|nr:ribosome-associated translation inhibitor RaiA [Bacillota bacterium]
MKYQIIGKNIAVTDAIRETVEKKLSRMDKYFIIDDSVLCRAVVQAYKVGAKVEITVFTKQMDLRTEVRDNDLYAAVDLAIDKLEDQMRRLKTRMDRTKERTSLGRSIVLDELDAADEEPDEIVRSKSIFLEPMSIDEAITRMEGLGHSFFVYLDADDEKVCVAYKRLDGGFGVIEVENKLKQ